MHEPPIVFLDEPTGGVDPVSRRRFWDLIEQFSRSGVTVLVTTHYLDEAEHCHRVAIINAGRLAALGSTDELKQIFKDRPIVEVHAASPVEVMRLLDGMPAVEKTSVFGTAVHAVLRPGHGSSALQTSLAHAGVDASVTLVEPSLEDVFLEVAERAG
jgi:drug efflux transport system ATP-binding protein